MKPVEIVNGSAHAALMLTCEHASCALPAAYRGLGLQREQLEDHIGWDIGAAAVSTHLAESFAAPAILSQASRLLIDCNRDLGDHDLIVEVSDDVVVPGNAAVDAEERARRIEDFYVPYHRAVDAVLREQRPSLLLSVHSFTPSMKGRERPFDVGVLFDVHADEATQLGADLSRCGLAVRFNEPYSGLDGLIYSARTHGQTHGVRYLELEINNALLRDADGCARIAARLVPALARLLEALRA